jgi:FlaG/FlaF family flagellin (archaellin)
VPAGKYHIAVDQGSTFRKAITWKDGSGNPVNLAGYSARMQVRSSFASSTVVLSMTTVNGKIMLGGSAGTISLYLSASDTAALSTASPADFSDAFVGVYDLELVAPNGDVTRLLQGSFAVNPEVTR